MIHALSFDLEEWYHPEALRTSDLTLERIPQAVAATTPILDLLDGIKATFFVVGETAAEHPQLIERILSDGHELAFHGWTHKPLWALDVDSFSAEIEQFLKWCDVHAPGVEIWGYRAPTFSLDHSTAWAIPVLQDHGFRYDASVFPAKTSLYGVPNAPLAPYFIDAQNPAQSMKAGLLEIPMSVTQVGPMRIGFTGGLYLRALPYHLIHRFMKNHPRPAVMYIHPWETYAATPRCKLSRMGRFILYHGLPSFKKLERLLADFQFGSMRETISMEVHYGIHS